MKVVINSCYGGFGLSHEGWVAYAEECGFDLHWIETGNFLRDKQYARAPVETEDHYWSKEFDEQRLLEYDLKRDDPGLVGAVERIGSKKASGKYSELRVVEIPNDIEWDIEEYDGSEWVSEVHRIWR